MQSGFRLLLGSLCLFGAIAPSQAADRMTPPEKGDLVPPVTWQSLDGKPVELAALVKQGPVVLVVLRGFPGYQCPICNRQVGELLQRADDFRDAGATVVCVYPGPAPGLAARAKEFLDDKTIPDHFRLVLDPDLKFTTEFGLRWDAPRETAYPSTFVIGKNGKVAWSLVSREHGGRSKPDEILRALKD
jgi:peroxiredoxin